MVWTGVAAVAPSGLFGGIFLFLVDKRSLQLPGFMAGSGKRQKNGCKRCGYPGFVVLKIL